MNPLVATKLSRQPLARGIFRSLATASAVFFGFLSEASAVGTNSVTLAWNPNTESDLAGYRLQYGTTSGVYPAFVDAGSATTATVSGLNQGTTYYFTVVAYNDAGQVSTTSSQVSHTVPGTPNTAPSATSFAVTVGEDAGSAVAVTLSGSDPELDLLGYTVLSNPTKGTLTGSAPNLAYKPAANANGSDSFTYRVSDGELNSATATVSITITPVNDAPVATGFSLTTAEDTNAAAVLQGSDVDGNALTYTIVTAPVKGTFSGTAPNLTYRPNANATGSDSFTYRVNDGTVNSATATVNVTITPANDAPVAVAKTATTTEDTAVVVLLAGTDAEGSALTYAIVTPPAKGTLSGTAPNLTYLPNANANGSDSFIYRVNDGSANSANASYGITITAVNDAPVASPKTVTTAPNTPVAVVLGGSDVDGNPLTYTVLTQPAHGSLSGTAPNLTYTPAAGYTGGDSFTFRASDGTLNSAAATVSLSVATSNLAPVAQAKSTSTLKNRAVKIVLAGSDPEGKPLTFRVLTPPAAGKLTGVIPNLTFQPGTTFTGNASFTYVANDGASDSAPATVTVKVKPANLKSVATPRSAVVNLNTATIITVAGTDPDGDALTYAIAKKPLHGTITGTGPGFTYTPVAGYRGADTFTFTVTDGILVSLPATVSIKVVNPANKKPVAVAKTYSSPKGKRLPVVLQGTDGDGDALKFRVVTKPAVGTLSGVAPNLSYMPPATFTGTVSFTFVAADLDTDSNPATITINVVPPVAAASRTLVAPAEAVAPGGEPSLVARRDPARPGILLLDVSGTPGQTYTLESSGDLTGWSGIRTVEMEEAGSMTLEMPLPAGSARGFFRLRLP